MGGYFFDAVGDLTEKKVLDHGCGVGRIYRSIGCPKYYIGVDISGAYLDKFREDNPNAQRVKLESLTIPLCDKEFDVVTSYSVFTHLEHEQMPVILSEFNRVLKDDGKVAVSVFELEVVGSERPNNWICIPKEKWEQIVKDSKFTVDKVVKCEESGGAYQSLYVLEKQV